MGTLGVMLTYVTILIFASATSFFLTPLAKRLGPRLGAMDMPNPLSIHSTPTPRTGGLAIFPGFLIAVCLAALMGVARFVMGKKAGRWEPIR